MIAMEKVTFNLPSDLKEKVTSLKDDLKISMSAIYTEAIKKYVQEQEAKKWQKAASLMAEEYKTNPDLKAWQDFEEDVDEYSTK